MNQTGRVSPCKVMQKLLRVPTHNINIFYRPKIHVVDEFVFLLLLLHLRKCRYSPKSKTITGHLLYFVIIEKANL